MVVFYKYSRGEDLQGGPNLTGESKTMHSHSAESAPVGVVPRRDVRAIEPLMSDTCDACTVADDVESPGAMRNLPPLPHWLTPVVPLGLVAALVEWLRLTR